MSTTSVPEQFSILTVSERKSRSSFSACLDNEFFPLSPVSSTSISSSSSSFSTSGGSPLVLPPAPSEHSSWSSHSSSKGKLKTDGDTIHRIPSSCTPPVLENEDEQVRSPPSRHRLSDGSKETPIPGRESTPTCDLTSTSERQLQWDYTADLAALRFDFSRSRIANQNDTDTAADAVAIAAAAAADQHGPVEQLDSREDSGDGVWTWPALTETTTAWKANRCQQVDTTTSVTTTTMATTTAARTMESPQAEGENGGSPSTSMTTYNRLSFVSSPNPENRLGTSIWSSGSLQAPSLRSSIKCHSLTSLPASGYPEHKTDRTTCSRELATTSAYGDDRQADAGDSFQMEITSPGALSANESFSRAWNSSTSKMETLSSTNNNNDPVRLSCSLQTSLPKPKSEATIVEQHRPRSTRSVKQRATNHFLCLPHHLRRSHSSSPKTADTSISVSPSTATVSTCTTTKSKRIPRFRDTADDACQTGSPLLDDRIFHESRAHSATEPLKDLGGERLQQDLVYTGNQAQMPISLHRVPTAQSQVTQITTTTYATGNGREDCQAIVDREVRNTLRAFSTAESSAHRSICSLRKHAKDVLAATEEAETQLRLRLHNLRKALSAEANGSGEARMDVLAAVQDEGFDGRKDGHSLTPRKPGRNRRRDADERKSLRKRETIVESDAFRKDFRLGSKTSSELGLPYVPLFDFNSSAISQGDLTEADNESFRQKLEDYRGPSGTNIIDSDTGCSPATSTADHQNLNCTCVTPLPRQRFGAIQSTQRPTPVPSIYFPNTVRDSEARNETPLCAVTRLGRPAEHVPGDAYAPCPLIEKTVETAGFSSVSSLCTKSESTVPASLSRGVDVPLPMQCPLSAVSSKPRRWMEPTDECSSANHQNLKEDNSHQEDQQQSEPTSTSPPSFYDRREDWANVPRALGLCSPRKSPRCSPSAPAEPVSSAVPPSRNEQPESLAQKLCLCEHRSLLPHTSEMGVTKEDEEEEVVITPTELSDTLTMPAGGVPLGDEFRCKLEELIRQEMVKLKRTKQAYVSRKQIIAGLLDLLRGKASTQDPLKSAAGVVPNTTCMHNQQTDDADQAAPLSAAREGSTNLPSTFPLQTNTQGQQFEATNEKPESAVEKSGCGVSVRVGKKVDVEKMYTEYMDTVRVNRRPGGTFRRDDDQSLQTTPISTTAAYYDQREDWANVPRAIRRTPAAYLGYSENYPAPERPSVYHRRDFRSYAENQLGEVMEALVSGARHKRRGSRPYDPWGLEPESPPPEMLLNTARAARGGLCWFEPVPARPASDGTAVCALRKSLEREHSRQSNLYWNHFYANRNQNHSAGFQETPSCVIRHPKDENSPKSPPAVGDLQAAFNSRMQNFVARSRGRQQWIRSSAQERHLRPDSHVGPRKRQPGLSGKLSENPKPTASEPSEVVDRNMNNFRWSRAPKSSRRRRSTSFPRQTMDPFDQHRLLQAKQRSHLLSNRIKMKVFSEKVRREILGRGTAWM